MSPTEKAEMLIIKAPDNGLSSLQNRRYLPREEKNTRMKENDHDYLQDQKIDHNELRVCDVVHSILDKVHGLSNEGNPSF